MIDGPQEAALSFLGGTRGLDPADGPFLLLDIGGRIDGVRGRPGTGSAEDAITTQIGSVRLTERCSRHDPPSAEDLRRLAARPSRSGSEAAAAPFRSGDARIMVAVAGTATTVQAFSLGLERYDPDRDPPFTSGRMSPSGARAGLSSRG